MYFRHDMRASNGIVSLSGGCCACVCVAPGFIPLELLLITLLVSPKHRRISAEMIYQCRIPHSTLTYRRVKLWPILFVIRMRIARSFTMLFEKKKKSSRLLHIFVDFLTYRVSSLPSSTTKREGGEMRKTAKPNFN